MVGVEPAGDGLPHNLQRHPSRFGLDRLEVVEYAIADQARGFGGDLAADFRLERRDGIFFWADLMDSSCASHIRVLTSNSSRVRVRARRYSAICVWVSSTASAGMVRVRVLPSTAQVNDQLGP